MSLPVAGSGRALSRPPAIFDTRHPVLSEQSSVRLTKTTFGGAVAEVSQVLVVVEHGRVIRVLFTSARSR